MQKNAGGCCANADLDAAWECAHCLEEALKKLRGRKGGGRKERVRGAEGGAPMTWRKL